MSNTRKVEEFPAIQSKLGALSKRSMSARAEAEAKRQREEAETAAVYEDFVKSFDHGRPQSGSAGRLGSGLGAATLPGQGISKRRFNTAQPSVAGRPGQTGGRKNADMGKKRFFEDTSDDEVQASESIGQNQAESRSAKDTIAEERAAPRQTLHLSQLPPNCSVDKIQTLFRGGVDEIRMLPPSAAVGPERRSLSAIVMLSVDTPSSEVDKLVSSLHDTYMGFGYHLTVARHLSSAALSSLGTVPAFASTSQISHPFGAKVFGNGVTANTYPGFRGQFAPPTSITSVQAPVQGFGKRLYVPVQPPTDLKQLKLINRTIETLLSGGPEFEALLMSRPEVQSEEKWTWLWDARSPAGVWYRWRLWDVLSGTSKTDDPLEKDGVEVFESAVKWTPPQQNLKYEFVTKTEEFLSDDDYHSSSEDEEPVQSTNAVKVTSYLDPYKSAKLRHLLQRLPTSTARLRKGDVARITAFAIDYSDSGADEVVEMIVHNAAYPYSVQHTEDESRPDQDKEDNSAASLIGLYVISDILSCSSTSGVRHAWKYRASFEQFLLKQHTFVQLARFEEELGWGRLKADKWKRSVFNILTLWEGWCVFPQESYEAMVKQFTATTTKDKPEPTRKVVSEEKATKWRSLDQPAQFSEHANSPDGIEGEDLDGEPIPSGLYSDLDEDPMDIDESQPEEPEPVPSVESVADPPVRARFEMKQPAKASKPPVSTSRHRVTAVDMFANESD